MSMSSDNVACRPKVDYSFPHSSLILNRLTWTCVTIGLLASTVTTTADFSRLFDCQCSVRSIVHSLFLPRCRACRSAVPGRKSPPFLAVRSGRM